jgi:hypothetical protein
MVFLGRHVWRLRAQIFLDFGLWGGVGYTGGNSAQVLKKDITGVEHIAIVVLVIG